MDRRSYLKKAALLMSTIAGSIVVTGLFKQFYPSSAGKKQLLKIGSLYEYPVDTFSFLRDHKIFIYRDHEGVRAVSAVCTHLGCTLEKSSDGFECPCHGSCFNDRGNVLSGPAPRNLSWYKVGRSQDGKLVININQKVESEFKYIIS